MRVMQQGLSGGDRRRWQLFLIEQNLDSLWPTASSGHA